MNRLKLFFALLLAFCAAAVAAVDIKELRIAIMWNPNTYNLNTPYGWEVGGNDKVMPWREGDDTDDAPEIGLAQLKFVLSAIHDEITTGKTLDTAGFDVDFEHRGGDHWAGLENVRVYNTNSSVSYSDIVGDFDGKKPHVVCYINAGADVDGNEKDAMFELFTKASENNVGVLLIGSKSAINARDIDPTKEIFPVMGVQKKFRVKMSDGDPVYGFQFFTDNDKPNWKIADTVLLKDGKIYRYPIDPKTGKRKQGDRIYNNGKWENCNVATGEDAPSILYNGEEWSIKAMAVEIIDIDEYPAEMNYGLHMENDFAVARSGADVYVINDASLSSLVINGKEFLKKGACLTDASLGVNRLKFDVSKEEVTDDWIIEAENPENGNKKDKIVVIRKGFKIKELPKYVIDGGKTVSGKWQDWYTVLWGELCTKEPCKPFDDEVDRIWNIISSQIVGNESQPSSPAFIAGGLRELRIELMPGSDIYRQIFVSPNLNDAEFIKNPQLFFKPWSADGADGRISADADLWEFNNQLPSASFNDLISGGKFDKKTYYRDYLATQKAGRAKSGYQQFAVPPSQKADFETMTRADELPATLASSKVYYDDFKDKIFHTISAVQKDKRRLAMIGYQPTYLKDKERSRAIVHDLLCWIGFDHYSLPQPEVTIDGKPADNKTTDTISKPISDIEITITVDTKNMDEDMIKCSPWIFWEIWYNGRKIAGDRERLPSDASGNHILLENYTVPSTLVDPSLSSELLEIKTWMEPNTEGRCGMYSKSEETDVKILRERSLKPNTAGLYDTNADGKPDKIVAPFDTLYCEKGSPIDDDLPTKVFVKNPFTGQEEFLKINKDRFYVDCDRNIITIELTDKESDSFGKDKTVFDTDFYLQWFSKNFQNGNTWGKMEDKIAPVIVDAYFKPGKVSNGKSLPDMLEITFSEELNSAGAGDVFYIYDSKGKKHAVKVKSSEAKGKNIYWYVIEEIEDNYVPVEGDLINVNVKANLKDKNNGNSIDNENNKKQPLRVGFKEVNLGVNVITKDTWNKDNPNNKLEDLIKGKDGEVIIDGNTVVVTILDPGYEISAERAGEVKIKNAAILDAVGNKVIEMSEDAQNEHFKTAVVLLDGKVKLAVSWDGKNSNGRNVGSATYMLYIISTWPGNKEEQKTTAALYVPWRNDR